MNWTAATHVGYLVIAVPLTIWVARTLSRNGRVFLKDVFHDQEDLADAVNTLLVVGFYLLNVGFVLLYLRSGDAVLSSTQLLESLSRKTGVVMVMLGLVHFCNVYVFNAIRRRSRLEAMRTPPVPPQGWLMPQAPLPQPPR
jgi:hypothetical protein